MDEKFSIRRPQHLTKWLDEQVYGWVHEQICGYFQCEDPNDLPVEHMKEVVQEWDRQERIFHQRVCEGKSSDGYFCIALRNVVHQWELKNDTLLREI
jgi:hypothetical protein